MEKKMKRDKVDILMDIVFLALLAGLVWVLGGLVVWLFYHWGHDHSNMVGGALFSFGALRGKVQDLKAEVERLRANKEVLLWHITPSEEALASILQGGFAPPRHESTLTENAPWIPKWVMGQQGQDRVSCGLPGLWMLPWMIMKEMLGEGGPILEIRISREELLAVGTVMRTANAALPVLTAPEINVPRGVMNRLLEEGRVRYRNDIPEMEFKEWLRLTLNGEQGLVPHAERELRKMVKHVKPYRRLVNLGAFAVGMKGSMESLQPRGVSLSIIKRTLWGAELIARRGWGPLSPEPELDGHLEAFLQEIYEWEPKGFVVPDFDFNIEVPKFEFPEFPSIDRMLERGRKHAQWEEEQ